MKTLELTATQVRNDFFKILNEVIYLDTSVLIRKAGTDKMAKISSVSDDLLLEKRKSAMQAFDEINKNNRLTKKDIDELIEINRKERERL